MNSPEVFDVVVVGFGIAGATAAIYSLQRGASTLVIDAASVEQAGGNSLVAGQGFISTREPHRFAEYLRGLSVRLQDVNRWAELSARLPKAMSNLGVSVDLIGIGGNYVDVPGAEYVERWKVSNGSRPIVETLQMKSKEKGVVVKYRSRVCRILSERGSKVLVEYQTPGSKRRVVTARYGVILASGGYGARLNRKYAHLGTPFAQGDGIRLAAFVGGATIKGSVVGPYYAFPLPNTPGIAVTPEPAYLLGNSEVEYPLLDCQGYRISPPETRYHGLQRPAHSRGYRRQHLPDAYLVLDESRLAAGPLVRQWPDAHAEGWARRYVLDGWSSTNEVEMRKRWLITVLRLVAESGSKVDTVYRRSYVMPVRSTILNTLGGLRVDDSNRLLGNSGPIQGIAAIGELASIFTRMYEGSGNITECFIGGRRAVTSLIGE